MITFCAAHRKSHNVYRTSDTVSMADRTTGKVRKWIKKSGTPIVANSSRRSWYIRTGAGRNRPRCPQHNDSTSTERNRCTWSCLSSIWCSQARTRTNLSDSCPPCTARDSNGSVSALSAPSSNGDAWSGGAVAAAAARPIRGPS